MIDLYTWPTPNGHKVHIMLEETGIPYRVYPVNIGAGEQFAPSFLEISPNNKLPAMVDPDGPGGKPLSMFESGAMLVYLASKSGRFLPEDLAKKWSTLSWLMFQMGEANRLYGVIDRRLKESAYIACDEYTIADMAIVPWLRFPERQGVAVDEYPYLKRWRDALLERPAVKRALEVLAGHRRAGPHTDKEREILFGNKQYQRR